VFHLAQKVLSGLAKIIGYHQILDGQTDGFSKIKRLNMVLK